MKKIGIITNRDKDIDLAYTAHLIQSIKCCGGEVFIEKDIGECLGERSRLCEDDIYRNSEIVVCLGGDGTFLKVARSSCKKDIPVLGINLGTLGFLTEVDKNEIDKAVEYILQDKFSVEHRMMLDVRIIRGDTVVSKDVAFNDVVITRGSLSRIVRLKAYINDNYVDCFPGDGLIVSTPTGSTAYSLSAGGPIVEPDTDIIILTPICPHIIYSRSYITNADRVVKIVPDENFSQKSMVTIDGQEGHNLKGGDVVEIKKSKYTVKMARMNSKNFFNILRTKIYDRGTNRSL